MKLPENPAAQLLKPMFRTMVGINIPIGSEVIVRVTGNEFLQTGVGIKAQRRKAQCIKAQLTREVCDMKHFFYALPDIPEDEIAVEEHAATSEHLEAFPNVRGVEAFAHGTPGFILG